MYQIHHLGAASLEELLACSISGRCVLLAVDLESWFAFGCGLGLELELVECGRDK